MLMIDYIKLFGVFISLYVVSCYKRRQLHFRISFGRYEINYANLMLGYFISTLICSLIFWPNVSTYAAWLYYGILIVSISIYEMLFIKRSNCRSAVIPNLLIVAECFAIGFDDLYWDWQLIIIGIGLFASIILSVIIAVSEYHLEQLKSKVS